MKWALSLYELKTLAILLSPVLILNVEINLVNLATWKTYVNIF